MGTLWQRNQAESPQVPRKEGGVEEVRVSVRVRTRKRWVWCGIFPFLSSYPRLLVSARVKVYLSS